MFAGLATGGIPGSGSDRSAIGLATGQVAAALDDAERVGDTRPALARGVLAGADPAACGAGRKIITLAAITATTARDAPPNHTRRGGGMGQLGFSRRSHWRKVRRRYLATMSPPKTRPVTSIWRMTGVFGSVRWRT